MGVQGSRASLAEVGFRVVRAVVILPTDMDACVLHSAVLGGFDAGVARPL